LKIEDLIGSNLLNDVSISLFSSTLAMISSVVAALVIKQLYLKYGRSMNNRAYFGNIFVLLCVVTCTVIIIVKYSLALSLGLVGALSIVRFRAAIKEPEELVYLFLVIALGLAFGANQFAVGYLLLIFTSIVILIFSRLSTETHGFDHTGIVITISGNQKKIKEFKDNYLESLLKISRTAVVKEVSYDDNFGRILLKISTTLDEEGVIQKIEDKCLEMNLNVLMISDVSVPA
jgi:hypothetical protein